LIRLAVAAFLPPFQDEAYYWVWSLRPALGYFDHPPAIAWLIAPGVGLLGDTALGIRLVPILAGLISMAAVMVLARRIGGERAATLAAWTMVALPIAVAGLLLATPDAPLFLFLALAMVAVDQAVAAEPGSREDTVAWLLAGLALGGAFTSKYTGVLYPFGVTVAFLLHPQLRRRFATPGPWLGSALALALFLPVVIWNGRNDWASFAFQLGHGLGPTPSWDPLDALSRLGEMIGGQMGLASPILFVLMVVATWRALRRPQEPRRFVLAVSGLVMFGFFVVSALQKRVEPNWPALAYLPGIVLLATEPWKAKGETWVKRGLVLGVALGVLVHVQALVPILPLSADDDPIAEAYGWAELAGEVQTQVAALEAGGCGGEVWVAANRYQDASETQFHRPGRPLTFSLNLGRRPNHYDYWPGFADLASAGDCLVAIFEPGDFYRDLADHVGTAFGNTRTGPSVGTCPDLESPLRGHTPKGDGASSREMPARPRMTATAARAVRFGS